MWSPKYVELRDPSGKLLQKTVQHTEDGPIELLFPIPGQPKSNWVGLTDDEINDLVHNHDDFAGLWELIDAVEAKLKRKNNG